MNKLNQLCDKVLQKNKTDAWYIDPTTRNAMEKLAQCSKLMYAFLEKHPEAEHILIDVNQICNDKYPKEEKMEVADNICGFLSVDREEALKNNLSEIMTMVRPGNVPVKKKD